MASTKRACSMSLHRSRGRDSVYCLRPADEPGVSARGGCASSGFFFGRGGDAFLRAGGGVSRGGGAGGGSGLRRDVVWRARRPRLVASAFARRDNRSRRARVPVCFRGERGITEGAFLCKRKLSKSFSIGKSASASRGGPLPWPPPRGLPAGPCVGGLAYYWRMGCASMWRVAGLQERATEFFFLSQKKTCAGRRHAFGLVWGGSARGHGSMSMLDVVMAVSSHRGEGGGRGEGQARKIDLAALTEAASLCGRR